MGVGVKSSELPGNRMSSPSLKVFNYSLEAVRDIVDEAQVPDKQLNQKSVSLAWLYMRIAWGNFKDTDPGAPIPTNEIRISGSGLESLHC